MQTVRCRNLWTGSGPCLSNTEVTIDDEGLISTIQRCSSASAFDFHFAMPSFVDAHVHYSWMVVKEASLDLSSVSSADEILSLVSTAVNSRRSEIIRGESFDESDWRLSELPSLKKLDAATGAVPVFLRRICGHAALVNSAMLELLPSDTPDVNRSNGILKEWPVLNFEELFPLSPLVLADSASKVESMIFSRGVTGVFSFESASAAEQVMNSPAQLDISVAVMTGSMKELLSDKVTVKHLKIFLDGAFGARNAAILTSYPDGSSGDLHYTDEELLAFLIYCGEMGLSLCVHVIGGNALQQLDRVSNRAFRDIGRGFPIRIEHAEDLLNAWPGGWNPDYHIFSMQPNFVERWQRPGGMYDKILPVGQSVLLNPFRTVIDSGFRLGFGSDCMPLDPLYGLLGAISHRSPEQSLSVHQALHAYTLGAASIAGFEHLTEPLGRGRTADMVFLSKNPFEGIEGITVDATMKNGETVYDYK